LDSGGGDREARQNAGIEGIPCDTTGWTLFIVSKKRRVFDISQTLGAFDMKPIQDRCPGWQHSNDTTNILNRIDRDWWNFESIIVRDVLSL
jgi:hypothetical protein